MRPRLCSVLLGLAATAALIGLAELVSRLLGPGSAPLLVLGQAIIPLVPTSLITPVIAVFGDSDKPVLVITVALGALALGALIGRLGAARPRTALAVFSATGLLPVLAVLSRPGADPVDVVPTLIGIAVGVLVLWSGQRLVRGVRVRDRAEEPSRAAQAPASPRSEGGTMSDSDPASASRRRFFVLTGLAATIGAVGMASGQSLIALTRAAGASVAGFVLPRAARPAVAVPDGAGVDVTGIRPVITEQKDFYRIDTVLAPPRIDPRDWSLRIHGKVATEVTITMDELLDLPLDEQHTTLTCVSNPVGGDLLGTATWLGHPVRKLLERARPDADADMVLSHSHDGFTASTPLEAMLDDRDALLAVGMNGEPLTPEHGFPARLVVAGLYGFVSATKWVTELELTRFDEQRAYWTQRGWDAKAPVLVASRIDVPGPLARIAAGTVVAGGTAWAQRRGIAQVQVRLDAGEWTEAELGAEVTVDTWRQWRAEFADVAPGQHSITVRAVDRDGTVQTAERRTAIPNSATGHHRIQFTVE